MSEVLSYKAALYRGLTLSERIGVDAGARGRHASSTTPIESPKFSRWQAAFADQSLFDRRLAAVGIDAAVLRDTLAQGPEDLRDRLRETPRWISEIEAAFDTDPESAPKSLTPESAADNPRERARAFEPLLAHAFEPLLARGRAQLQAGLTALLARYPRLAYDHAATLGLETALLVRVRNIATRTLILELNVARLQGVATGETPEARFADFAQRLEQPAVRASLFSEYPVLVRQIAMCIDQWVATSLEFIERLGSDWEVLREALFACRDPGPLVAVEAGQGDSHRGGRAVTTARFASGAAVVYKPRSQAVDRHFYALLRWLNARGMHTPFCQLVIIDRGTYGWEECVERTACASPEEVERFYARCGAYLALLYALHATDFHFENLIAVGEHPVMVDLEALFHPRLPNLHTHATAVAGHAIGASVLSVGLLPYRVMSSPDSVGLDVSGLGGEPDQITPHDVPVLAHIGTDRMAFEPAREPFGGGCGHRPSLHGTDVAASGYAESIVRGFALMYRLLCDLRTELLAPDGPIEAFAHDDVRVILRPTQTYAELLATSFHPDLLHDALDRELFFDKLWTNADTLGLERVVPHECADLQRGDIPVFITSPQSGDLWTSGGSRIDGMFPESGLVAAHRRIAQLGEDDLATQLWFVRASLGGDTYRKRNGRLGVPACPVNRDRLLAAATAIGDRLERLAIHGDAGSTWIGASAAAEPPLDIKPLGPDLGEGLSGVVLFLAHLGSITGEPRYTHLARLALVTLRSQIAGNRIRNIGALHGWGGVIYAVAHLGQLWAEPEFLTEAVDCAELAAGLIETDRTFDVVGGAAGCALALLALDAHAPSESVRRVAQRCGEHLLKHRVVRAGGSGWIALRTAEVPLTGFSHGAAGIALALLRLGAVTRDNRFRAAAQAAIEYERGLFSHEAENWPDLRPSSRSARGTVTRSAFQTSWCHGAPGIGLARLACADFLDDPIVDAEIDSALRTTEREGFGGGHSLCHGELGNLELLHVAAQRRAYPALATRVQCLAAAVLDDAESNGWQCGNPAAVETPGLMTGLAGIGYQLLRLADPACVPSILAFDPPIGAPRAASVAR